MKVRTRSRLILIVTIIVFLAVLSFISQTVIVGSFSAIEDQDMTAHVQRAVSNLNEQQETLAAICEDWASQQEIYDIAAGNGSSSDTQTTHLLTVKGYDIDYILVYNASGTLVYAMSSGNVTGIGDTGVRNLETIVKNSIIPEGFPIGIAGRYGISELGGEPVILAGYPVVSSNLTDQPRGTLVIARTLTNDRLQALENVLQVPMISLQPYNPLHDETLGPQDKLQIQKGRILTRQISDDRFEGTTAITGIENTPTFLILTVGTARPVYHQVQTSLVIFACVIIAFSTIFLITVQLLMQRYILGPISSLDDEMKTISRDTGITSRVNENGDEEIASLKRSLNRMLDEIQHYHEELKISQETLEERNQQLLELNRKANLYLDIYLDVITYEILNSLMGLRGYADLIQSTASGKEAEFAGKIATIVQKSSDVIRNIETISRIYKNPPVNHSVDLGLALRNEIQLFPDMNIRADGCNYLVIANEMLGVIFNNLFSNSLKYGGPQVEVRVRCHDIPDGFIEVSLEDNGPGIPDKMKKKIFDRFGSDTKTRSSYGLGLHIVKMLVESYGGRIWADDRIPGDPGKGGAIRFTLRIADEHLR